MNTDRIKEIQHETGYPDSVSVQQALLKVWNEVGQEIASLREMVKMARNEYIEQNSDGVTDCVTPYDRYVSHREPFIPALLKLVVKYEVNEYLQWSENLRFYVQCSDVFVWGCADAEEVTEETLPELEQALIDCYDHGDAMLLYCARRRKMRPCSPFYGLVLCKKHRDLFDACGPERE